MLKVFLFGILLINWCRAQQTDQQPAQQQPTDGSSTGVQRRQGFLPGYDGVQGGQLDGGYYGMGGFAAQPGLGGGFGGQAFNGQGLGGQGYGAQGFEAQYPGGQAFTGQGFGGQDFGAQGVGGQGFGAQGVGRQGLTLNDIYNLYGGRVQRINAAVTSRRDVQVVPSPSQYEDPIPLIVDIDPIDQPLVLNFGSRSSSLHAIHSHEGQQGGVQRTQSQDEPYYIIHEVIRPIIQEVREVIRPQRRIIQEIAPIEENIRTIVAQGDRQRPASPLSRAGGGTGATGGLAGGNVGIPGLLAGNGVAGPVAGGGLLGGAGMLGGNYDGSYGPGGLSGGGGGIIGGVAGGNGGLSGGNEGIGAGGAVGYGGGGGDMSGGIGGSNGGIGGGNGGIVEGGGQLGGTGDQGGNVSVDNYGSASSPEESRQPTETPSPLEDS